MHPYSLAGKRVLVTGASSGIGRQTAVVLAELGATLLLNGRDEPRLSDTLALLEGKGHEVMPFNLNDMTQLPAFVAQLPTLNGLAHCAGIWKPCPIKFIQDKHLYELMQTNYVAAVMLVSEMIKQKKLAAKASLVFISSVAAQQPYKGGAAYAASKAALEAFSKTLALEYAHKGMRSNCIAPAMVKTPIFEQSKDLVSEKYMQAHEKAYPLRVGLPEDVAQAVGYLLSDASGWVTGTVLRLDGGLTIGS